MKYFRITSAYNPLCKEVINKVDKFCQYLSAMYEYYFNPIKTEGVSSMNICIVDKQPEHFIEVSTIKDCFVIVDWNELQNMADKKLIKYLLECCQAAIIDCIKDEGWNTQPFEEVYEKIIQKRYLFREYYKKPTLSPNKQNKAQIYFEFDYKNDATYIEFRNKKEGVVNRIQFTPSGYSVVCGCTGSISWLNENTVRIAEVNRKNYWDVSLDGSIVFSNINADKNDAHALYQIGLDYFNGTKILKDEQKGLHLIQISASLGYKHAQKWLDKM